MGFPSPHYFLIDDAQMADDTDIISATSFCWSAEETRLALFGDAQQGGPATRSTAALQHGLSTSLLGRILEEEPYVTDEPGFVSRLSTTYGMHPAVMHIPAALFYQGSVMTELGSRSAFYSWQELPNAAVPLVYHGVRGTASAKGGAGCLVNVQERDLVMAWVQKMLRAPELQVAPEELCVVALYAMQADALRLALRSVGLGGVHVGTPEELTTRIFKAAVVSTVCASREEAVLAVGAGLLGSPRRFCTAVTRAQTLLVVVGHPEVLTAADVQWAEFLDYCRDQECATGDFDDDGTAVAEVTQHDTAHAAAETVQAVRNNNLPLWRSV